MMGYGLGAVKFTVFKPQIHLIEHSPATQV